VISTKLRGFWLVASEAARRWRDAQRGGAIVDIASIQAQRTAPGLAAHSASKAAMIPLTRSLALEWARHDIRVNALEPGYMRAELTDQLWEQLYGQAMIKRIPVRTRGDLDGALLLLATRASAWTTGADIAVDGGHLLSAL